MQLMYQLFGSVIPMFANIVVLVYVFQRFLAATKLRQRIMTEMKEFSTSVTYTPSDTDIVCLTYAYRLLCEQVRRARDNVQYIGEQVARGMDEIKEDVKKELRVTDRLTTQSSRLAAVLRRFTALEENVIELVRMERNRESVRIETPMDVSEEIERILAAVERKKRVEGELEEEEERAEWSEESKPRDGSKAEVRTAAQRNPLSKFSACGPREIGTVSRRTIDGRPRISTMPEVRLLGEQSKQQLNRLRIEGK